MGGVEAGCEVDPGSIVASGRDVALGSDVAPGTNVGKGNKVDAPSGHAKAKGKSETSFAHANFAHGADKEVKKTAASRREKCQALGARSYPTASGTFLVLLSSDFGDNAVHRLCNVEWQEKVAESCGVLLQATRLGTSTADCSHGMGETTTNN